MKCQVVIDKNRDEEIIIYAHERTELTDKIERIAAEHRFEIIGYKEREIYKINTSEVYCFTVESNKVYALCKDERYTLKMRLYELQEMLGENFIKINQSCIANIEKLQKFDASISGALIVVFKNGYTDCVSRRNLKNIKERLGI